MNLFIPGNGEVSFADWFSPLLRLLCDMICTIAAAQASLISAKALTPEQQTQFNDLMTKMEDLQVQSRAAGYQDIGLSQGQAKDYWEEWYHKYVELEDKWGWMKPVYEERDPTTGKMTGYQSVIGKYDYLQVGQYKKSVDPATGKQIYYFKDPTGQTTELRMSEEVPTGLYDIDLMDMYKVSSTKDNPYNQWLGAQEQAREYQFSQQYPEFPELPGNDRSPIAQESGNRTHARMKTTGPGRGNGKMACPRENPNCFKSLLFPRLFSVARQGCWPGWRSVGARRPGRRSRCPARASWRSAASWPSFSPIGRRLARRARLEAIVGPEVLLGVLPHALLDEGVHAPHVRLQVAARIVGPGRVDVNFVARGRLAGDHGQHRRAPELREPRQGGHRRGRHAENTRAAEERLHAALGARVEIARRGRGGAIRVLFTGEAELNRLFELMPRAGRGR